MTVQQIFVPYIGGYDFGVGADMVSGAPMGKVVDGVADGVKQAGGTTANFQISRIQTTEQLEQTLGIDIEASYGCAAFGAGISARFSYAKNSKIQSSSLFMTVSAKVDLEYLSIDDPMLTPDAAGLVDNVNVFAGRYGNVFVRGMGRGGLFVGVLRIDTHSDTESESVAAELKGSYGLFAADAKAKFEQLESKYRSEVFVQMYHEGGRADLKITDPTNPLELLNNANLFLESFSVNPDSVAVAYNVALAPIGIARGPLPVNAVDIDHAQDVLVFCARRRSALLDELNLLQFILDNPARYDWSKGPDVGTLAAAVTAAEADLDLLAACASAAMNSPSKASMPVDFAPLHATTYPKLASMPNPLPAPLVTEAPATVSVPNLVGAHMQSVAESAEYRQVREDFDLNFIPSTTHGSHGGGEIYTQAPAASSLALTGTRLDLEVTYDDVE